MKKITLLFFVINTCAALLSQSVAGFQEYFVPGPENDLSPIWDYVYDTNYDDDYRAVISITATSDDTEIIYDHWEDGLTAGSTTDASTEVITLDAGEYYAFDDTDVNVPVSGINYDGGDRIYVTGGPVFVARAAIAHDYMAACWELLPVQAWRGATNPGVDFVMPFGTDLYFLGGSNTNEAFHDFMKVAIVIQSAADGNNINVACPNDSTDWVGTLNRGETKYLTSIQKGATITCSDKSQVQMIIGSNYGYDIRGISGIPAFDGEANNYWAPIKVSGDTYTDMFIYNHNATSITINYEDGTTGSFSVDAGETASYHSKTNRWVNSGAHVYSDDEFCAVMSVDTDSGTWDWAAGLTQNSLLGTDYRIGWAPGGSYATNTKIDNCIFVIVTEDDTDIFVDFDGNGSVDQSFNGPNTKNKLDVVLIGDQNDYDTSGARIWTNDKKIALAFGEISGYNEFYEGTTPNGSPGMDLGYAILPMPDTWLIPVIEVTASDDQGGSPVAAVGDNVTFTIRLDAHDYDLTNVDLSSVLDLGWEFEDDSTVITHYNSSGVPIWSSSGNDADPALTGSTDPGVTLTWDISRNVNNNEYIILTFNAHPTSTSEEGENEIVTETVGTYSSHSFNAYDSEFVTLDGEPGVFGDEPLPVMLSDFAINIVHGTPLISWITQSESNSLGWNIFRNTEENMLGAEKINSALIAGAGNSSSPISYDYTDNSDLNGNSTYWYFLENVEYTNTTAIVGSGSIFIADDIPIFENKLFGNYPNPFNPTTEISFSLKETNNINLSIYNYRGQKIVELVHEQMEPGDYSREWNGKDSKGYVAGSGIYFYTLTFGGNSITKKMVLLK